MHSLDLALLRNLLLPSVGGVSAFVWSACIVSYSIQLHRMTSTPTSGPGVPGGPYYSYSYVLHLSLYLFPIFVFVLLSVLCLQLVTCICGAIVRVQHISLSTTVLEPCRNTSRYPWVCLYPAFRQKYPKELKGMIPRGRMTVRTKKAVC